MNSINVVCFGFLLTLFGGCASKPEPLEVTDLQEIQATVTAVDAQARTVSLRGPAGNELTLRAGAEVRNLAQVEVGDILSVSYYTAFLVAMAEPGSEGADLDIAAARAETGDRPGAIIGATTRETVEVVAVAEGGKVVTFRGTDGALQSIDVPREEGQAFARKLRPGDLVDMQYSEAVAVSVEGAETFD